MKSFPESFSAALALALAALALAALALAALAASATLAALTASMFTAALVARLAAKYFVNAPSPALAAAVAARNSACASWGVWK